MLLSSICSPPHGGYSVVWLPGEEANGVTEESSFEGSVQRHGLMDARMVFQGERAQSVHEDLRG
jgi:hypothetical protein